MQFVPGNSPLQPGNPEETPFFPACLLFATPVPPLWYLGIRGGKEVEPG